MINERENGIGAEKQQIEERHSDYAHYRSGPNSMSSLPPSIHLMLSPQLSIIIIIIILLPTLRNPVVVAQF